MQNKDIKSLLHHFSHELETIDDLDYGDFMRKATLYLNHLDEKIYDSCNEDVKALLDEMKLDIQYRPNWDIESTRAKALLEIHVIESILS